MVPFHLATNRMICLHVKTNQSKQNIQMRCCQFLSTSSPALYVWRTAPPGGKMQMAAPVLLLPRGARLGPPPHSNVAFSKCIKTILLILFFNFSCTTFGPRALWFHVLVGLVFLGGGKFDLVSLTSGISSPHSACNSSCRSRHLTHLQS